MKIQAVNTSFKGLFTDKSAQNGGNWYMEYRPYSWESNNTGKMAPKAHVDEFASTLPDNEEIFTRGTIHTESSKDILGTESYYKAENGTMRRKITEAPAMNREESLKVLDKKLAAFLELKQATRDSIEASFAPLYTNINQSQRQYENASERYHESFFGRNSAKEVMDQQHSNVMIASLNMYDRVKKYTKLMGSIDDVNAKRKTIQEKIKLIGDLRESGHLVDISRRDIINPNEALVQTLKNMREAMQKFVCLPNETIPIAAILEKLGKNASVKDIIMFIETRMNRMHI